MHNEDIKSRADEARKILGQLWTARDSEVKAAKARLTGLETDENHVLKGTKVALQVISKERRELLDCIGDDDLADTPSVTLESPDEEDNAVSTAASSDDQEFLNGLYSRSQLQGMSNERLQQLAGSYGMDLPIHTFDRETAIDRIIQAQARWCEENGHEDPNHTATARLQQVVTVHEWSGVQWLLAFFGAFIALLIATATRGVFNDIVGFGRGALVTMWYVALVGTGFFGGGLIGSLLSSRSMEHHEEENEDTE